MKVPCETLDVKGHCRRAKGRPGTCLAVSRVPLAPRLTLTYRDSWQYSCTTNTSRQLTYECLSTAAFDFWTVKKDFEIPPWPTNTFITVISGVSKFVLKHSSLSCTLHQRCQNVVKLGIFIKLSWHQCYYWPMWLRCHISHFHPS